MILSFSFFFFNRIGPLFNFTAFFNLTVVDAKKDIKDKDDDKINRYVSEITFQIYHGLRKIKVPFLDQQKIKDFTGLESLLHYITSVVDKDRKNEADAAPKIQKLNFLERQIELLYIPRNGSTRVYDDNDIMIAFKWFAQSRALYTELRKKLELPGLSVLNSITTLAKHTSDSEFFKSFFGAQIDKHRGCILLIDEVYVKASIIYVGE